MVSGFFAGGLAEGFGQQQQRNQTASYEQGLLNIQRQRLQNEQQREQMAQWTAAAANMEKDLATVWEQGKITGQDSQTIAQHTAGAVGMLREFYKKLGYPEGYMDAKVAGWSAAPPKTQILRAEAEAKETPALAELRRGQAAKARDPFGIGAGTPTGLPSGAGYQPPGQNLTDQDARVLSVEDVPPGAPLPGATQPSSGQFPIGGMIKSPYTDIQGKILEAAGYTKEQADFQAIQQALGAKPVPARSKIGGIASNIITARSNQWLIENNVEPGSANARKAATAAAQSSLTQMTRMKNQIEAFEGSELKNLDVLEKLASKVDTTGIPVFERWIRAGRVATGDPDVAAFNTQMSLVQAGAAKIITNPNLQGVLTDQQIREIQNGFPSASNLAQIKSITALLKGDFARRSQALDEQIDKITTSFGVSKPKERGSSQADDPLGLFK